jgi:hypothetical protein
MSDLSSRRFHLELQKSDTWSKAQRLAGYLEGRLHLGEYLGPVVVAGGCLRDMTLGRTPKDLDVFLDGGCIRSSAHGNVLAGLICAAFGHGAYVLRTLKSYGTWAADVDYVIKIAFPEEDKEDEPHFDVSGIPIPYEVDVIVLNQGRMSGFGYRPAVHMTHGTKASFLAAVLARMDIRLNAIGACATSTDSAARWTDDALMERLVVQYARAGEDESRILARLNRFAAMDTGKYAGWRTMWEGPDGEASDHHPTQAGQGAGDGQVSLR